MGSATPGKAVLGGMRKQTEQAGQAMWSQAVSSVSQQSPLQLLPPAWFLPWAPVPTCGSDGLG